MMQEKYKIDSRNSKDIMDEIEKISSMYVPEWKCTTSNPDIGSVLAMIFSHQMGKNINRFNDTLDRYRTELMNLMEISPMAARPAQTSILMNVAQEADTGVEISKGSRFLADTKEEKIIFETAFPIYLTPSRLRTIFMTLGESGHIVPIKGNLKKREYIEREKEPEEAFDDGSKEEMRTFSLFRFAGEGIERQAAVLYHSYIFDEEEETIYCRIKGAPAILDKIEKKEIEFLYYTEDGFLPVEDCFVENGLIVIHKNKKNQPVEIDGNNYSIFVLEAKEPQTDVISVDSIEFSTAGDGKTPLYVGNGTTDYEPKRFAMFGNTLSLFSECFIGFDHYFSKKGAVITLDFHASFMERYVGFSRQEEEEKLKVIKRKPRAAQEVHVSYAKPEEISIEYFNGIGWKRLECDREYQRLFAETKEADYHLSFLCPKDWAVSTIGSYEGRALRIQLQRADNCYYHPCFHQLPIISDMKISYSYENMYEIPEKGEVFSGTGIEDITQYMLEKKRFTLFSKGKYEDTSLYLGFDKKLDKGPISLWWQITGSWRNQNSKLHFYYSTIRGFKEVKVIDYTAGLTRSGIVMFLPPADMAAVELEGEKRYWLKITGEESESKLSSVISRIEPNGVFAFNVETLEEEEYYLDEAEGALTFPLGAQNILDAKVWVNEIQELSEDEMERMAKEMPDKIRMERNYLGKISEFYVQWEEISQFYSSGPEDRHYILDRMNSRIIFGNGVHIKVPTNTEGAAFLVQLRCCSGAKGNVEAGAITESSANLLFVHDIYNPEAAFGGSDMETMDRVLERGAFLFSSRNRLVTAKDYEKEVLYFSENIDKTSIIHGIDKNGRYQERAMSVVLLMKDCMKGRESFYRIQEELKKHLLTHCDLSITSEELQVEEPIFVKLNTDVWIRVMKMEDSFEIQGLATELLNEYLTPVSSDISKGWEIGELPRKSQIMMRLNSLKSRAKVEHVVVTAVYEDSTGVHETDLDELKRSPYMVVMNGEHKIHISSME